MNIEKIKPGMKLKRKNFDYAVVTVLEVDSKYIKIQDKNGDHYITNSNIDSYFSEHIEDDPVIKTTLPTNATLDNNLDDPERHNINTANRPSAMQEAAFRTKDK